MNKPFKEQLEEIFGKPKKEEQFFKGYKRNHFKQAKKPQNQRTEVLSEWDIKDLMGMNKQRLKRAKGGAYRR